MALFNYATKEITLKIVYYGPGLSGKTTNLQYLHASVLNPQTTGKLLSLATESDRTLFFDFLPVELGKIRDFNIRFQLYTVPGQVRYNATRKVVLKGADAVVFVADSQTEMREQNIESFDNMRDNLVSNNINPDDIPVVLQYNKRDLGNISPVEEINSYLNPYQYPVIESSAINGAGVEESFRLITRLMLKHISRKHKIEIQQPVQEKEAPAAAVARQPRPEVVLQPQPQAPPPQEPPFQPPPEPRPRISPAAEPEVISVEEAIEIFPEEEEAEEPEASPAGAAAVYEQAEVRAAAPAGPIEFEEIPGPVPPATPVEEAPAALPSSAVRDMEEDVRAIREALAELQRMGTVIDELAQINGALTDLKNAVYIVSKEVKELRELRRSQEETNNLLRAMLPLLEGMKAGRGWFRF